MRAKGRDLKNIVDDLVSSDGWRVLRQIIGARLEELAFSMCDAFNDPLTPAGASKIKGAQMEYKALESVLKMPQEIVDGDWDEKLDNEKKGG